MKIKDLKELDLLSNSIFQLQYIKGSIYVMNKTYLKAIFVIESLAEVEELKLYGFDVETLRKADLGVIEAVAEQYRVSPRYIRGTLYYGEDGSIRNYNDLLRKEGYYI